MNHEANRGLWDKLGPFLKEKTVCPGQQAWGQLESWRSFVVEEGSTRVTEKAHLAGVAGAFPTEA